MIDDLDLNRESVTNKISEDLGSDSDYDMESADVTASFITD